MINPKIKNDSYFPHRYDHFVDAVKDSTNGKWIIYEQDTYKGHRVIVHDIRTNNIVREEKF